MSLKPVEDNEKQFKAKATIFLSSVAGLSAVFGFISTLAYAKRKDPISFSKGISGSKEMAETGASLALRALGIGSIYAFLGCGCLSYVIWKGSGAKDMEEFRIKMGSLLPRIPKNDPPQGRTEFEGLTDLLNYVSKSPESDK